MFKSCAPPKDGGSAKGVVRYILGYELGAKREEWEIRNASYHSLIAESLARPDLGVGTVWRPAVGEGIRPSSVLVLGVASLATADVEIQAMYQANKRVKVAAHHEVFAFGNDIDRIGPDMTYIPDLTDERALEAVVRSYQKAGLGDAAMVLSVHRDSYDEKTGKLLLHVHVARSGINPKTLRAYDHQRINTRMDRAARAVEIEMGLFHDRGLAVVDYAPDGTKFVRDSTVPERIAWRREEREERLIALERSRYIDNAMREGSFERYAEARIEPRMREVLRKAADVGAPAHAIDVANTAARLGCVLQLDSAGALQLRDVSTARLREKQREEIEQAKADTADWKSLERDENLGKIQARHKGEREAETRRLITEGAVAPVTPAMAAELKSALRDPRILADEVAVERAFVAAVDKDPALVSRALTQQTSTFSRADVDRFLVDRIYDVGEVERLAERIFAKDKSLVMLSPDVADGVWTTTEMQAIEQQIVEHAEALAQQPDRAYSAERRAQACAAMESERSVPGKPFVLSQEQKTALSLHGGLVVILGHSGAGKTTAMEAIRRDAQAAGRSIRGVTIAQAAALRLEVEAGFGSVNTVYALLADGPHRELIPKNGILVIDEAGMVDSRTMRALLRVARERNSIVVAIGDPRQIQAVGAGGCWNILAAAARAAGTFAELTENRRQIHEYHRRAVSLTSHAIEKEDASMFARAVRLLEKNDALAFVPTKDDAIAEAVAWYVAEREKSPDVLLVATDRDTVRYLNEDLLRRREGRGFETRYLTEGGTRGLAIGDRFIFGENNTKLGVVNGDTGTVTQTGSVIIGVQLDRTGEVVSFDSNKYQVWDHGYATTVARAQGASVRALGGIVDGAATAEAFHVLIGRSKAALRVLVPKTAFEDALELAEHLRDRIVAKGTSVDISGDVAKRGGPETDYARNVNAQRISAENPDRQEYEREWTAMRNRRDIEIRNLAAEYRAKAAIATPKEKKHLRSEQRKAEAAIVTAHEPEDFGVWLHRKAERDEVALERLEEMFKARATHEQQPAQSLPPKQTIAPKVSVPSPADIAVIKRQQERDRANEPKIDPPKKSKGMRR
jgi:hypothetical protein